MAITQEATHMLVPITALLLVLIAILVGALYKAKKRVEAHREDDAGRPAL